MNRLSEWLAEQLKEITRSGDPKSSKPHGKQFFIICLVVFFLALGVRLLTWHDLRLEVWRVETYVTSDYKYSAYQLLRGDLRAFCSDVDHLGHPPGYPILLAGIFKAFGDSDAAIQFVQMIGDSVAAVLIFLIVSELLELGVAIIAGLLAGLSPQFANYSVLLLPDSLAVLPILLAVYFTIRASKRPRLTTIAMAGAFVGASCWLRANALLLPLFLTTIVPVLFERGKRLRYSAALILGAVIVIAPITIKNLVVFHHFIPLSLGAGQKLLEGIAEYDRSGELNIPRTDLGIMRQEAELYQRPDYALWLFGSDGIERDHLRVARGLAVIRSHPIWYFGVMLRRAISFFKLARVPILSPEAPVSHALDSTDKTQLAWANSPSELIANGSVTSMRADISLVDDGRMLRIVGDETKYGTQIVSMPISVGKYRDYMVRLPLKLEEGRAIVKVTDLDQSKVLASIGVDLVESVPPAEQPLNKIALPFVSGNVSQVRLIFANNAPGPVRPVARIGQVEMFELGPSAYQWMRYPRFLIRNLQRFFLTAWMLPLTIFGAIFLIRAHRGRALMILLIVPAYYLVVQSALHTEHRYVIAIHYFLVILVAISLWILFRLLNHTTLWLLIRIRQPANKVPG